MLIINADDFGGSNQATDNSLACYKLNRITSASAMVFMNDSERAAELANEHSFDVGLHFNFTTQFDGNFKTSKIRDGQQRIASFLRKNKYCSLLYNPFLKNDFEYIYRVQYEEYVRLYQKSPTHIDGHRHMHLCTNILVDRLIPRGSKVRRSFTFSSGEKNILNRFYRRKVDAILTRRYICTDAFFSIAPHQNIGRLNNIIELAKSQNVEMMVHPERQEEFDFLMTDEYSQMISNIEKRSYAFL
jgi:predicted glycoside hydrolase/deacetylase ChbG (UPF0249 family)